MLSLFDAPSQNAVTSASQSYPAHFEQDNASWYAKRTMTTPIVESGGAFLEPTPTGTASAPPKQEVALAAEEGVIIPPKTKQETWRGDDDVRRSGFKKHMEIFLIVFLICLVGAVVAASLATRDDSDDYCYSCDVLAASERNRNKNIQP